ncbi:MAG: ribonuclease Y [Clostridia bacterium]|nr:ribonuclease Y [Clostridia bacterium]
MPDIVWYIITGAACALVFGFLGVLLGIKYRKKFAEAEIGSAEQEAKRIIEEGSKTAEQKKKEMLIEAKEEILKNRNELEREIKERRGELSKLERRCVTREETLDRKIDQLEKKEEALNEKVKAYEAKSEEIEGIKKQQLEKLEELSGLTADAAKELLIAQVEEQARYEASQKLIEIEEQLKEDAEDKARNIISLAISRIAGEQVAEATVSVVALPNDDMKGRIIGREGRNIRAVETATGVDLIIDDTPEAITISSFDPIRREVARLTLEKLVADGRIHPTRIEETVEKAKKEVDNRIKQAGEKAVFETGIHGLNNELVKILGRLMYRTSYGQNVLNHSVEVSYIAGIIADELGVDGTLARRAGLLHDIGKAMTAEVEGSHVQIGVEIAKKYKENKDVIHAIEAHHGDVEPRTITALIVQAADAISAARPGARREDIENFIKRLQKLEEISQSFPGVEKAYAIQAGREVRVMVKPEDVSDQNMVLLARDIARKIEGELKYPGQIKVNLIRESRATDYAK